jgi:hypothetical protein
VTVRYAGVTGWQSVSPGGTFLSHPPAFVVQISFKNYNDKRILTAGPQTGNCALSDDVGNTYRELHAVTDLGLPAAVHGQIPKGKVREVRSDEKAGDAVVFDRPVKGANEVRLTLDARAYGGSGRLVLKVAKNW